MIILFNSTIAITSLYKGASFLGEFWLLVREGSFDALGAAHIPGRHTIRKDFRTTILSIYQGGTKRVDACALKVRVNEAIVVIRSIGASKLDSSEDSS